MNPTRLTGPHVDIRRAPQRCRTHTGWLDSHHSFSFAGHYAPDNTHHGQLLVSNDDVIKAGTGVQTHPHQDMEIVTWVLSGKLGHQAAISIRQRGAVLWARAAQARRDRATARCALPSSLYRAGNG